MENPILENNDHKGAFQGQLPNTYNNDDNQSKDTKIKNNEILSSSHDFKTETIIKIAAIDNGLAFPFKHPDEWRACKFFKTF